MTQPNPKTARSLAEALQKACGDLVSEIVEFRGECSLTILDKSKVHEVCQVARDTLHFDMLTDVSSVDHYGDDPRFEVVYELYGMEHHAYLRLKVRVEEESCELPSVTSLWRTADWHEREIYDMMGIRFSGHPDLRRILMWDGYPYFPLRKDFPLEGKPTDLPETAFTDRAPLEGGPFVTTAGKQNVSQREPRAKAFEPED
jgi:NADH-quinone oxidoreductase subunit C